MNIMQEHEDERDPLQKQLANIKQIFQEFADQYEAAANALREGRIPEPIPSIQLDAARKVVSDTFAAISEAGQSFNLEPLAEDASLISADEYLLGVIEAKAEAERRKRIIEEARMLLIQADSLQHTSGGDALPRVKHAILELNTELDAENIEEAEQLIHGKHPLAMLVAYVGHRETLDDEEYDTFRENIQEHFGRPLLRDIDRGRVILDEPADLPIREHDLLASEDENSFDPVAEIEIDESLLDEADIDVSEEEYPPVYSDYDAPEGEDTLLPFLEGDGMDFEGDEMPEATVNENTINENGEEHKEEES